MYRIPCKDCECTYVGETKRALSHRKEDHERDVENKVLDKVIPRHCVGKEHNINWNKISILDFERNYWKRRTSEMLHIHLKSSSLNKKEDTRFLHDAYVSVLDNIKHKF